jgi:hypothetical protein
LVGDREGRGRQGKGLGQLLTQGKDGAGGIKAKLTDTVALNGYRKLYTKNEMIACHGEKDAFPFALLGLQFFFHPRRK